MTGRRAALGMMLAGLGVPLLVLEPLPPPQPPQVGGTNQAFHMVNDRVERGFDGRPNADVLAALDAMRPLADESDPAWQDDCYWLLAYRLGALNEVAGRRKLRPAVARVLDRMCYGDPGEMMRGFKHAHETTFAPDWPALADVYLRAATSPRPGTRYWALDGLIRLDDPRSRLLLDTALRDEKADIRGLAEIGLERLARLGR